LAVEKFWLLTGQSANRNHSSEHQNTRIYTLSTMNIPKITAEN